jgi:hypothetical protein
MDDDTATHADTATPLPVTSAPTILTTERPRRMPTNPHLHASDEPEIVRTPQMTYASIRGSGSPGTDEFYRKKTLIGDIARQISGEATPVIEIQYWYPEGSNPVDIADFYSVNPIPSLEYRVLSAVPDHTTPDDLGQARTRAASPSEQPTDVIELHNVPEQNVVQVMHHGPFAEEFDTLARLGTFASTHAKHRAGPHHELHIDGFAPDTPQDTLRTILRDPVA